MEVLISSCNLLLNMDVLISSYIVNMPNWRYFFECNCYNWSGNSDKRRRYTAKIALEIKDKTFCNILWIRQFIVNLKILEMETSQRLSSYIEVHLFRSQNEFVRSINDICQWKSNNKLVCWCNVIVNDNTSLMQQLG